jgi:nucleotide-binding universal stress UspA family protein
MFKNVLVGVDGRSNGRDAIALASRLRDPDGKLTLAHVHRSETEEERDDSRKLLEAERIAADVEAELVSVVSRSPGRGLHVQAETQGADLLVVGSCHRGAFGRAMLGDDTRAALNGAPCAIAIAAVGYAERLTPFSRIGVAYNSSPESNAALAAAREIAAPTRASVNALEVVSLTVYSFAGIMPPAIGESIDTFLQEGNKRLQKLPGVEGHAAYGIPREELAAFGDQVDILVVGSRSYGPIRRMVLGSTSAYLERHARCSLLIVPRGASAARNGQEPHRDARHAPPSELSGAAQ